MGVQKIRVGSPAVCISMLGMLGILLVIWRGGELKDAIFLLILVHAILGVVCGRIEKEEGY